MQVLLVYPLFPKTGSVIGSVFSHGACYLRWGLVTLAAHVPELEMKPGYECRTLNDEEILPPIWFGREAVLDPAFKAHPPGEGSGQKIVLGADPSSQPEAYHEADFLVAGEAETVIPEL